MFTAFVKGLQRLFSVSRHPFCSATSWSGPCRATCSRFLHSASLAVTAAIALRLFLMLSFSLAVAGRGSVMVVKTRFCRRLSRSGWP